MGRLCCPSSLPHCSELRKALFPGDTKVQKGGVGCLFAGRLQRYTESLTGLRPYPALSSVALNTIASIGRSTPALEYFHPSLRMYLRHFDFGALRHFHRMQVGCGSSDVAPMCVWTDLLLSWPTQVFKMHSLSVEAPVPWAPSGIFCRCMAV